MANLPITDVWKYIREDLTGSVSHWECACEKLYWCSSNNAIKLNMVQYNFISCLHAKT